MRRIFSKILLTLLFCLFISSGSIFAAQTVTFNYNVKNLTDPAFYHQTGDRIIQTDQNSPNNRLLIVFELKLLDKEGNYLDADYEIAAPNMSVFAGGTGSAHHDINGYLKEGDKDHEYFLSVITPTLNEESIDSATWSVTITGKDKNGNDVDIDRVQYKAYPDNQANFGNADGYNNMSNPDKFEEAKNFYDLSFKFKPSTEAYSDIIPVSFPVQLENNQGQLLPENSSYKFILSYQSIESQLNNLKFEPITEEITLKDGKGTLNFNIPVFDKSGYRFNINMVQTDPNVKVVKTSLNDKNDATFSIFIHEDESVEIQYDNINDSENYKTPPVIKLLKDAIPIKEISLERNKELKVGDNSSLKATISPDNSTEKGITWNSSNPEIVEVDQNGKLTAKTEGNAKITVTSTVYPSISATCDVTVTKTEETKPTPQTQNVHVIYSGHIQDIGWSANVKDGQPAGTTGQAKRLEAIKINLVDDNNQSINGLGIQYKGHVQNIGWQNYVSNGDMCGTEGKAYRVEALQVQLTGSKANDYDVFYRSHVQNIGWTGWTKNNAKSGSEGLAYQVESIEIKVLPKNSPNSPMILDPAFFTKQGAEPNAGSASGMITVASHVQDIGWQTPVTEGSVSGTTGQNKKVECIKITKVNNDIPGDIETSVKVQDEPNWRDYVGSGKEAGTTGRNLRMDGIKIRLTGELAQKYDVAYRSHIQDIGWENGWKTNDQVSGAVGQNKKIEAIEVMLVPKGTQLPNV